MKTCYVDVESRSIADLVPPGELTAWWTITRINVPQGHRGKGIASKLLKQIIENADQQHCVLALEVQPSDGLDYEALVSWYQRHGFKSTPIGYMVRRPA